MVCPVVTSLVRLPFAVFIGILSADIYYFMKWSLATQDISESENLFPYSQKLSTGFSPIASSLLLEIC